MTTDYSITAIINKQANKDDSDSPFPHKHQSDMLEYAFLIVNIIITCIFIAYFFTHKYHHSIQHSLNKKS